MQSVHEPVLLHEAVKALIHDPGFRIHESGKTPWYIDGTLGGAGHALAIAQALEGRLGIIGLDRDQTAIDRAEAALKGKAEHVILECANFRDMDKILDKQGINKVDMILLDLGISSDELESSGRGFSFMKDEPLEMTMGDPASYPFTAKDIVNGWKEEDIANVIFAYGEERYARRIAKAIVGYRQKKPIETSTELAELVKLSVPFVYRRGKIHPATKTFQALRITVNDELAALKEGLSQGYGRLGAGGTMAVISFHSLEDRIVKDFFKQKSKTDGAEISKKPIRPSQEEVSTNPRSRSAKLRTISKAKISNIKDQDPNTKNQIPNIK
ncbi:MAG: 16S rRNA (cytosine(1402)-N(4))-methyltransferase RsmH [Patescibacteria group bacterium]|nr:16S rRNA (cytosine(1402)-N(4))-methyltransferase RsmH [Patescibacteria group bacterium]